MATTTVEDDTNINPRYLDAIDKFPKEEKENANKAADYWYDTIGANVIPADTKRKEACIVSSWKQYQSSPLPQEVFERWKEMGLFANGVGDDEIPIIEVKNVGSLSFGWNSIHPGGYRYEFVNGIENPVLCDEFPEHIDRICKKHGLDYLNDGKGIGDIPIPELFKAPIAC